MKSANLSRNFLFLAGSNFAVQFMRFVVVALVARRIGNELFGAYNYLVLVTAYGAVVVEFGLRNVAIREFSQGRGSRRLIGQILRLRTGLAGMAAIVVIALAHTAFPDRRFLGPSIVFGASLFANAFLLDFLVVVEERFGAQAAATIGQAGFVLLGVFSFVRGASDFGLLAGFFLGGQAIASLVYFASSRVWAVRDVARGPDLKRTALHGLPFLIALLFFTIQSSADLLLLGQFHQNAVLGDYSAALKVISIPQGLIGAFVVAIQPRIARESGDLASRKLAELLHQTSRVLWIVLVPTVLGCWFFGEPLVEWVFGAKFPMASHFLRPLSLSFLFSCLALAPIQALTTSLRTEVLLKLVLGNAAFTFGVIGTALFFKRTDLVPWVMTAAQFTLMVSSWSCFSERAFLVREDVQDLVPAAILMTIPLIAGAGRMSPVFVFALSAIGYAGGLAAVRIWRRPWIESILGI